MNLLFFAITGLAIFFIFAVLRKWFDRFILIAFSIGSACCANYYHTFTTPIKVGPFVFALDSILFTLFLLTIIVKYLHYSLQDAKSMAISSVVAILISAFFEFFAKALSQGISLDLIITFLNYVFSGAGSLLGIWLMIMFLQKTKGKNIYIRIAIAIAIASIVDSAIYYAGSSLLVEIDFPTFLSVLFGSILGKLYSILLAVLCYYCNGKIFVPTDNHEINYHDLEE